MLELKNDFSFFTKDDATLITPEMAQELLHNNACIKPVNRTLVDKIKKDLEHDNFDFNGATIVLNENNILIDGRTRLMACVESGLPIRTFIVTGIDKEAQYTKDTGRSRNMAQYLNKNGYKHPRITAAVASILHNVAYCDSEHDGIIEVSKTPVTHQDILNILNSYPDIVKSVNAIYPYKSMYVTTSIIHLIVLDYLCRYIDKQPELADEFLEVLSGKRGVDTDHPVFQLRITLISSLQTTSSKLIKTRQVKYMIKAYNLLKEQKKCKRLIISNKTPRLFMISDQENTND